MARPTVQIADDQLCLSLLSTAHEGRGRAPRYRQHHLLFMHDFLRKNVDQIRTAIKQDAFTTDSEIDAEIALALAAVRRLYEQIDFKKCLRDEMRIARGEDNLDARIPYGIVLLRPTKHTRFFSIISAAATALAAGNVVLVEVREKVYPIS